MKIKMHCRFLQIKEPNEIQEVYDFIKSFPLSYPDYNLWVEKCRKELESGYKKGFYAKDFNMVIGSVIFQMHKQDKSILEIKNFRVLQEYANKGIGSGLYKLTEEYAKKENFEKVQVDAHFDNNLTIKFLLNKGFLIIKKEALYTPLKLEIILSKELK